MNVQDLPSGKKLPVYDKVAYQSPLEAVWQTPDEVVYHDARTGHFVGRVYAKDGTWFLSTVYFRHGQPIETMAKYEGFLLLLNLHKQNEH